ncbi:polysaccharide deacetylase family protein [Streptomyces puniciscabiei]
MDVPVNETPDGAGGNPLFAHTSSFRRPPLTLPGGARVAVWIGLNIEHFVFGRPALSLAPFTAELVPDPLNHGWRDYGVRAGFERVTGILDKHGVRASAIINADAVEHYPEVVEEGRARDWAWVAHGRNNSTWQTGMDAETEAGQIDGVVKALEAATGLRPRGWLGPALTSTLHTNEVLAGSGFDYVLDWANDDQPYDMATRSGRLLSVPYSAEINDIPVFVLHHQTGPDFLRAVTDQFNVLYEEGLRSARVLGIGLHPFLIGQPFRSLYLDRALEHLTGHADVWVATSDEIADWYRDAVPAPGRQTQ